MRDHAVAADASDATSLHEVVAGMMPGERAKGALRVGTMASGQPIELPWLALKGGRPGPCLWLNGAVHGDEINGVLASLDFFRGLDPAAVSGCVVVSPVSNPLGFDARRKRVPQDEQDLDQSFPGRQDGLTSELLAWRLFREIRGFATVLINFHTMNPYFGSDPYVVYKVSSDAASEATILSAAAAFEPFVACRMPVQGGAELPGNVAGALDYQASSAGAMAFMVELGGGSRQEPAFIEQGVRGLQRLSQAIGLLPSRPEPERKVIRVSARRHVMCRNGGLFRQHERAGRILEPGTVVGTIENVWGETIEDVSFPYAVALIGVRNDPVVHSGDRVAFVGTRWDEVFV
ncbi:MAG TPA: M14 family metallopeptidase [Alphaproteobacteria bacterium]|nr:M14 family metallopeptidase [Alphaproteobacteria bacterium]